MVKSTRKITILRLRFVREGQGRKFLAKKIQKKIVTAMEACKQACFRINMNYDFTITIPAFFPELTPSQGRG